MNPDQANEATCSNLNEKSELSMEYEDQSVLNELVIPSAGLTPASNTDSLESDKNPEDYDILNQTENLCLKRTPTSFGNTILPDRKRVKSNDESSPRQCQIEKDDGLPPINTATEKGRLIEKLELPDAITNISPLPPAGSTIFEGKQFIVITTSESDLRAAPTQSTKKLAPEVLFSKIHILKQICSGGGSVVKDFDILDFFQVRTHPVTEIFLIAIAFTNTKLYFKAVAANIPCVTNEWINECCRRNSLVACNRYLLPTGRSIQTGRLVNWHGKRRIFKGFYFAMLSRNEKSSVCEHWKEIVELAGGKIIPPEYLYYSHEQSAAVMIDEYYLDTDIQKLKSDGIKILTPNWITECVVTGRFVTWKSHPSFSLN